jgi:predicted dienelactone hydrolase
MSARHASSTMLITLLIAALVGCSRTPTALAPTAPAPTAVQESTPVPPTSTPQATAPQPPSGFPLSEAGRYQVGIMRMLSFEDPSRGGREVSITVWYPALPPDGSTASGPYSDAAPDLSGAPYPLVLSSSKVGFIFAPHLASYGFVVAGVNGQDSSDRWGEWLIDYPLDILFALDQIATEPLGGLEGVIDADHAGAMGYSFDGYNALAVSGARVDPEFYLGQCANAGTIQPVPPEWWIEYTCAMAGGWDQFAAHAGEALTASDDGLWQPMTDERIRAVMPMAPEGSWLFGERGLAAVDRPTLIIGATADDINIYSLEAAWTFEHLGDPARAMISFVGETHMMVYDTEMVARMGHFAVAFFSYHLQGRDEFAQYFSEDFVAQHDDLAWGVYQGE